MDLGGWLRSLGLGKYEAARLARLWTRSAEITVYAENDWSRKPTNKRTRRR
jgi:hypothetical protein